MAEIANTLWYRLGTVNVTDGSTKVTGVGTHWTIAGINPGATLRVDGKYYPYYAYEVKRVVSDTEIELVTPYCGGSASAASYSIDRNFQSTTNAKFAADITDLIGLYEQVRDGTMPMIEGKSAYQIAVANGFVGTEAEWLESLKGGGEIVSINGKLDKLYVNNAGAHNSFCRRKNLGTSITPEQIAAIRNGSYDDLYIGDHWSFTVNSHWYELTIANFVSLNKVSESDIWASKNLVTVLLRSNALNYIPINDTADCEGHLANSKLQTVTFPAVFEEIEPFVPSEHIVTIYESLADSIDDTGSVNHKTKTGCRMFLPAPHNMGLSYSPSWEKHDAYEYVSKIRWPLSVYVPNLGGYLAFSMNYDKTRWLSKVHPGLEYTTFPANSKAFEIQAYFFLG